MEFTSKYFNNKYREYQYEYIANIIYSQQYIVVASNFPYFRDIDQYIAILNILINILQYIDQYIGQSGVNISVILEYIDNILINISNNIGKY